MSAAQYQQFLAHLFLMSVPIVFNPSRRRAATLPTKSQSFTTKEETSPGAPAITLTPHPIASSQKLLSIKPPHGTPHRTLTLCHVIRTPTLCPVIRIPTLPHVIRTPTLCRIIGPPLQWMEEIPGTLALGTILIPLLCILTLSHLLRLVWKDTLNPTLPMYNITGGGRGALSPIRITSASVFVHPPNRRRV
mmetsp:Transcript_4415/g.7504  ORF Transcript_4415/g.7504 Transcript_4415/m.7504 type:complete len:191 (-) Transcript_4415:1474-2046(-)